MKYLCLLIVVVMGLWGAVAQASVDWPNEPAGYTALVDCNFSTVTCGGQLTDLYTTGHTATDGTAPLSPSSVLENVYPPNAGFSGSVVYKTVTPALSQVYIGFWWKHNTDFWGAPNYTNKIFFLKTSEIPSFFSAYGPPNTNFQVRHNMQNGNQISNCQVAGASQPCGPGTVWIIPTLASGTVLRNVWNRIEIYAKRSTSSTSQDGTLKYWLNGVLLSSASNVNWGNSGFNTFMLNHTWDGFTPQTSGKTWIHTFDHFRVSTLGGGDSADTTPPTPPTSLTAQ